MALGPLPDMTADGADPATADSPAVPANMAAKPWPRRRYAWYTMALITGATMLNFLDRSVFTLMIEFIKRDLHLSDIEIGLLLGPAGVLFYLFVGVPLARLVDIYPRTVVLGIGITITSGITSLGGLAQNYGQLFASRMLVGVGGSAHAPGSFSIMSDLFPPKRLPRAIAFMQIGFVFGSGLAVMTGGWLISQVATWQPTHLGPLRMYGWQWVLFGVGLPGLVFAFLFLLLPDPPRRGKVSQEAAMPLRQVLREIHARGRIYYPLFIGLALTSVESHGLQEWRAPFMMRTYGWSPARIGLWSGAVVLLTMPLGIIFGTWLTEHLGKRYTDAPLRTTASVFALALPFGIASPLMPTGELAIIVGGLSYIFAGAATVPQNAAIQTITPNEMRGQVTAIYLFFFTVFGALGSFLIALVTRFVIGDEQKLWLSMALVAAVLMPLAVYVICRGVKPYGEEVERLEAAGII